MRGISLLILALTAALVTLASATSLKFNISFPTEGSNEIYRLPANVIPYHYGLDLMPDFTEDWSYFTGTVDIEVNVVFITNIIVVHADNLDIDQSATSVYSSVANATLPIATQNYDEPRHFYILTFTANLPVGNYTIHFEFTGKHTDDMLGFYRSSYQVGDETRWLVITQFWPTAARRAFPCFDEPGLKATFSISLWRSIDQTALSNMPILSIGDPDPAFGNRLQVQFQQTPMMSTYLLAFVVSDFENVASTNDFFKIWSRSEVSMDAAWALASTEQIHWIYGNLLYNDYWPKLDQIAIPESFTGSVQNWGLMTYRENSLLWREGESSLRDREIITTTISRNFGQHWFGNLVSPKWWDDLWFSEGFAKFYELRIASLSNPQWRFAERVITDDQLAAMIPDSLESTRAMKRAVGSPASILASLNVVTYSKSSAVFRMLNRIMREDYFELVIRNFRTASAFGTFESENLWAHMQTVADANAAVQNNIPLATLMDSWVNQPGFPLVTVLRNYSTTIVAFSQERFFSNPDSPTADPEAQRWWIPITYTSGTNPTGCNSGFIQPDWLRAQDKAILVNGFANTTWVLANCQGIGFYRTNYDTQNWQMLIEFLKSPDFTEINTVNRAILIDDSLNLARAGYIDYSIPLDLIGYLAQETDFVVWRSAIRTLTYLNRILVSNENYVYWQGYLASLVSNLAQSLGWMPTATDDHPTRMHRAQIQTLACELNIGDARATAEEQFDRWIANPQLNPVDVDLKATVYCWGIRSASEATWDVVWNRFLTTDLATEKNMLLTSLACSQNSAILNKYLQFTINPNSGIRSQDTIKVFSSIITNSDDNTDLLLDFIAENTAAIMQFYGAMNAVSNVLEGISDRITRQDQLDKLRTITDSNELNVGTALIEGAIQTATGNLAWISSKGSAIEKWLQENDLIFETISTAATTVDDETTTTDTGSSTVFVPSAFLILSSAAAVASNYFHA